MSSFHRVPQLVPTTSLQASELQLLAKQITLHAVVLPLAETTIPLLCSPKLLVLQIQLRAYTLLRLVMGTALRLTAPPPLVFAT